MAAADYRLCDVCDGKAFYDSSLGYEWGPDEQRPDQAPFRIAGDEQYPDAAMNQRSGMRLGYLGDWAVLCSECAKTHKTAIVPHAAVNSHEQLVAALTMVRDADDDCARDGLPRIPLTARASIDAALAAAGAA